MRHVFANDSLLSKEYSSTYTDFIENNKKTGRVQFGHEHCGSARYISEAVGTAILCYF